MLAKVLSYVCSDPKLSGYIASPTQCEKRNASSHKVTAYIKYTCDGKTEVTKGKICSYGAWSNWTANVCTKSDTVDCESKEGYVYSRSDVSNDLRALYSTGYFSQNLRALPIKIDDNNVKLRIILEENSPIEGFGVVGNKSIPTSQILKILNPV